MITKSLQRILEQNKKHYQILVDIHKQTFLQYNRKIVFTTQRVSFKTTNRFAWQCWIYRSVNDVTIVGTPYNPIGLFPPADLNVVITLSC